MTKLTRKEKEALKPGDKVIWQAPRHSTFLWRTGDVLVVTENTLRKSYIRVKHTDPTDCQESGEVYILRTRPLGTITKEVTIEELPTVEAFLRDVPDVIWNAKHKVLYIKPQNSNPEKPLNVDIGELRKRLEAEKVPLSLFKDFLIAHYLIIEEMRKDEASNPRS